MLLKGHDLKRIIAEVGNLWKDVQTELLECSHLLLFSCHSDVALIDERMRTLARTLMLPLIWLRVPYLSAECLGMRILNSSGHICRESLRATAWPLYI